MRVVSSVFSWIGGAFTALYLHFSSSLVTLSVLIRNFYLGIFVGIISFGFSFLYIGVVIGVLTWRQISVEEFGNKIGCGVCTLLFCSLVGGILTLCIPENELKMIKTKNKKRPR